MARCPDGESLSYTSHNIALANGLYNLYNGACLLDVKLICNDSEIYAHKAVLAAGSQFFKDHLQYMGPGLAELQLSSANIGSAISAIDLRALIEYLYCGELMVSHARLGQVLALAHNLQIIGFHTDTPGGPPAPEFRLTNSGNSYEIPAISASTVNGIIHPVIPVEAPPSSQQDPPRSLIAVKQLPQASLTFQEQNTYQLSSSNPSLTQKLPEQLKPDVNLPGINDPNNVSFKQLCKSQGNSSEIFGGKHISQGKNLSSIFESSILEDNSMPYKEGSDYTRDIDLANVSKVGLSTTNPSKDGVRDCLVLGTAGAILESQEQEDSYAVMLLEALTGDATQDSPGENSALTEINGLLSAEESKTSLRNNRSRRPSRNTLESRARLKVKDSIGGISLHETTDSPSVVLNGGPSLKVKDSIGGVSLQEVTNGPPSVMNAGPSLKVKDSIGGVSLQDVTNGPQMSMIAAAGPPSLKVKDSIGGVSLQDMSQPRVSEPQHLGINECSNEDSENREWLPVIHNPLPLNTLSHNPIPHNPLPLNQLPPQQPISMTSQLTTICAQQIDINQEQSIICIEDPDIIRESSLPTDFSNVCPSLVFAPSLSSEPPHLTVPTSIQTQGETSITCQTISNVASEGLENQTQIVPAAQSGLISNNSLFVPVPVSASTENSIESLELSSNNQSSILTPQISSSSTSFFLQGSTAPLVIQPSATSVPSASLFSPSTFTNFTDLSGQSQLFNPPSFSYTPSNDLSGASSIVQVPSSIVFTNASSSQTYVSVCTTSPTILVSTSPQKSPAAMLTENMNNNTQAQPPLQLPPPPPLMALPSNIFTTVPTTTEPFVSSSITVPSNNSFLPFTTIENINTFPTTSTTSSTVSHSSSPSVIPFSLPNLNIPLTTMPTTIHDSVSTPLALCSSPLNSPGYSIGDEYDGAYTDDEDITFVGQNPPRNSPIAHMQILALDSSDEDDSGNSSEGLKTMQKICFEQPEQVENQNFNNDINLFQNCDNSSIIQNIEKERKKTMYQICENEMTNQEEISKSIPEDNEKEQKRAFFQDIINETIIPDDNDNEKEKKRTFDDTRTNKNQNTETIQTSDLIEDNTMEIELSCPHCLLKFKTVDEQNLHLWEQHQIGNGTLYKCEICEWSSAAHLALVKHAQTHLNSSNTRNVCAVCGKAFKTRQTLRIHIKVHRGLDSMFKCMCCPTMYSQKFNLIKHLASVHQRDIDGQPLTQKLNCPLCPYTAHMQYKIKAHIARRHCEDKPYKCDQCSHATTEKTALENHKRTHTKEKPYICHTCNFKAPTPSSLARHKRTHTKEKPYSCSECGQKYADSKRLRDHMLKHNNIKPFMCHLCGYTCRRKDNLQLHLRNTHTGESLKNVEGTVVDVR